MKTFIWQTRRSQFNHDWLKNQFLPALDKFINILNELIVDEEMEANFTATILPKWELKSAEGQSLAKSFECEMSPRTLFQKPPLANYDNETKNWLSEITHELWMIKYSVRQKMTEVISRFEEADAAYLNLKRKLGSRLDTQDADELKPFRDEFKQFRQACYRLALAIEKFPSEVRL